MNDGDWICSDPNCGNINFARRASCYRCNKERPDGAKAFKKKLGTEIGKSAAEKSRGLFNADDWQCNKCANVNWARRHTCNVCNAPKFGEVEARTGYGGGYNERGVVEYRRREPSSEDEYDEFGRRKRKRAHESEEKVGITEGPAFKKLPATLLQKEQLEHVFPGPAPKLSHAKNEQEKISGSLSDGSVCDLPPLSNVAFRRHQLQNQTNYHRQDHMLPGYKANGYQPRKRFASTGDRDQTGSSGYDTSSKKSKRESSDSPVKAYDPVMENRVSSTNNDFVYKFTGLTSTEDFQVTYTLEERVRAAAFALVYSNCKITTEKFEWLFDKPAPDFKTIFAWRQRLLTTGCLCDSHVGRKDHILQSSNLNSITKQNDTKKQPVTRVPNPDEIPIISDSDDNENSKDTQSETKLSPRQRSVSVETLLIGGNEHETCGAGSSISTGGRRSQARSQSESSNARSRSSSQESQDSNYPDTDSEKLTKPEKPNHSTSKIDKKLIPSKISVHDSDSESVSYNSEDDNFLSRVYGEGRKVKRKLKKRPVPSPAAKAPNYPNNVVNSFQGYSTAKPTIEQTPLVTGNIYTSNLRNMNVRHHDTNPIDTDGCSSEYIPTKLGSTTKNYQEFKNNVRNKGYWAKGNGTMIGNNIHISNEPITRPNNTAKPVYSVSTNVLQNSVNQNIPNTSIDRNLRDTYKIMKPTNKLTPATYTPPVNNIPTFGKHPSIKLPKETYPATNPMPMHQTVTVNDTIDFCNNNPIDMEVDDQFLPFDKPAQSTPNVTLDLIQENTSRIFDVVQTSNTSKNKSIMDIFMNDGQALGSPEKTNDSLDKYEGVHKIFETTWDDDDDALYKNDSMDEVSEKQNGTPDMRAQSPISNMLYATDDDQSVQTTPKKITPELILGKKDMLLGFLQGVNEQESLEKPVAGPQHNPSSMMQVDSIPAELSNETLSASMEETSNKPPENKLETLNPMKQIKVLESITIKPCGNASWPLSNNLIDVSRHEPVQSQTTADQTKANDVSQDVQNSEIEISTQPPQPAPVLDLSNLLSGINTNTLLLALQNLQQINQGVPKDKVAENIEKENEPNESNVQHVETINLTNDEDWEKESIREGSIERELQKLDGNSGDTPFLSDIFDPGPVVMPSSISRKLNINLKMPDEQNEEAPDLNDSAPVIGNFKSFALPKPIMLNRLKIRIKSPERPTKASNGKKVRRKKKSKASASKGEGEDEEEESGDEADLSKYDLWGSDEEQGNSSKPENADNSKEGGESSKEGQSKEEKNGKPASAVKKASKRSRSSSSSSSTSSSSSSSHSSTTAAPKNKFDDFNLMSEREVSPKGRKSLSRSRSPRAKAASAPPRRKSRDSRSAGESRSHDKEWVRDRERRDRSRGNRDERKERRYSREGGNHYGNHGVRGRHR